MLDSITARERTEGRQQADFAAQPKAGQAQALPALAAQVVDRVHVTGQHMAAGVWGRLVLHGERAQKQRLRYDANVQRWRRVTGAFVVVATNQRHGQVRMSLTPVGKCLQGAGRMRAGTVEKNPREKNQLSARQAGQQCIQYCDVAGGGAVGHRLPEAAIGGGLAEMNIGHHQGFLGGPVHGFFSGSNQSSSPARLMG
nr:hypothetical protein GCM10020185_15460 [Pseudomonas brassicacearum subsp. brassicacearum]